VISAKRVKTTNGIFRPLFAEKAIKRCFRAERGEPMLLLAAYHRGVSRI